MGMTRRSFLGLIGGVPLAASLASGCGFFSDLVGGDSGEKTVNVAVFLPQGEGANFQAAQAGNILASLQTAANEINEQSLGFRMEVNLTVVPPGPAFNFAAFFGTANTNAEPTPTPFSPIADTLNEAAASGQLASGDPLPDILMISNMDELPLLYAEGIIEPFEQATRVDGSIDLSAFAPGALEAVTWQGQVLVLPLSSSINTLTYDTDLFANAGVTAPSDSWSWTEMIEAGKRLTYTDDSGTQWGTYAHASVPMLLSLIWSHGGEVFSAENGAVRLSEPEAIRGIELWRDMITFHQIAPNPPTGTFSFVRSNRNGMQVVSFDPNAGPRPRWWTAQRYGALGYRRTFRWRTGTGCGTDSRCRTAGRYAPGHVGIAGCGIGRGHASKRHRPGSTGGGGAGTGTLPASRYVLRLSGV